MFPGLVLAPELDPATLRLRKVAKYARTSVVASKRPQIGSWVKGPRNMSFRLRILFEVWKCIKVLFPSKGRLVLRWVPPEKTVFTGFHMIFRFAMAPQMWVFFFLNFSPGSIQWTSKTLVDFMRPRGASGTRFLESMQELREKVCCYELYDYRFCWITVFVA